MGAGIDNLIGDCLLDGVDVLGMVVRGAISDLVDSARGNGNVSAIRVSIDARFIRRLLRLTLDAFGSWR